MPAEYQDNAYFLHQRPYRDNSALVHFLTRKHGKISCIVSGLKSKRNTKRAFLQPCRQLQLTYQLKSGLSKLLYLDFANDSLQRPVPNISQFMLYQYANELLLTILPEQLPAPTLFDDYGQFLTLLADGRQHAALRYIEIALITLFVGLPDVSQTADKQQAIEAHGSYWFYPEHGLFSHAQQQYQGIELDAEQLLAFQHLAECYLQQHMQALTEPVAQGAKRLTNCLLKPLLQGKSLKTRPIYQALRLYGN